MSSPRLAPAHDALAAFLGDWTGEEDLAASPWAPATTATATLAFRRALAGVAVVQDYRQRRADGGEFLGHGVFTADPATGETLWYLFDSSGHPPETPARGTWDGDTLTLFKHTARGTARHRLTVTGDRLTHAIDVRLGDAAEFAYFMHGSYRRVGDAPSDTAVAVENP